MSSKIVNNFLILPKFIQSVFKYVSRVLVLADRDNPVG